MEIIKIVRRERNLLEILMIIWEDSVRHTHDFLRESDIKALRPLVSKNLSRGSTVRIRYSPPGTHLIYIYGCGHEDL